MAEAGVIRISSDFRQDFDIEPGSVPHSLSSVGSCGGLTMYRIGIGLQRAWHGTVVPAFRTPALLLAACAVMPPAAMAQAEAQVAKRVVRTQDDLPRSEGVARISRFVICNSRDGHIASQLPGERIEPSSRTSTSSFSWSDA